MNTRYVRQIFLKGLIAVLPIAATTYIASRLIGGLEALFSSLLRTFLPDSWYLPGMGLVLGLTGIFLVGLVLQAIFARKVWNLGELVLSRMPVVSQLYRALKQVISYVSGTTAPKGSAVVLVNLADSNVRMLGLLTQDNLGFGLDQAEQGLVAVFLPWSYQLGGITVLVQRKDIEPVDLTPQEALRFSLTAGVSRKETSES